MFEVLENYSVLGISGSDAGKFLQSLTTNDIANNAYSYNYLLNNQGRYLCDFFVHSKGNNEFFLEVNKASAANLTRHLNLYKLRSDVSINDLSEAYKIIYTRGEPQIDSVKSNQDPRYKELGIRSIIKTENISNLGESSNNLYLDDKYEYSIPDGDIDLIFAKSIPIEYGAEELGAISYSKGCYVGQEVISRAKYQGVVRKKIYHIKSKKGNIEAMNGADVSDLHGKKIGMVCSTYQDLGIALLREEFFLALAEKVAMIDNIMVDIKVPAWRK